MAETTPDDALLGDIQLLGGVLDDTLHEQAGEEVLALVTRVRAMAEALRGGRLGGGRDAFAHAISALDLESLERLARSFTLHFHLINAAEEQHRIRTLRRRDRPGTPPDSSIAAACAALARAGVSGDEVRALLGRLFVMPVLTAHPTEARRRTVLDHLADVSSALDRLDDPRPGAAERSRSIDALREAVLALHTTEEARAERPTPLDEIRAGLHVFERTLLAVTPAVYRDLEDALAASWPDERFTVGPFLRWGTWIGGDRDGNPRVTADTTRAALERQRALVLDRYLLDVEGLGRELSMSESRLQPGPGLAELEASLVEERGRFPDVAVRVRRGEPWREKLWYVRARLLATRGREEIGYAEPHSYLDDLRLVERTLDGAHLGRLARGRVRDAVRRAEVFGFHLASLDLRQHSDEHAAAVAALLERGGVSGYAKLGEDERVALLAGLLERADVGTPGDRDGLPPAVRDLLRTLEVVGRARRDQGPAACERWVVSFTRTPSDLLEVLFLSRAAGLSPVELRPVPLLEQLEDLERAGEITSRLLDLAPVRVALRGELEVMLGYSDSGKQAGYVASTVALKQAQESLAALAERRGVILTVFHGRGGAIGRGGGPESRAIRAQPPQAVRGRIRITEQGETIATRYGRAEIARRDLGQMINGVLAASLAERRPPPPDEEAARRATLARAAESARGEYGKLLADRDRLARYAVAATPIQVVAELPIASRPAARRIGLAFEDLRAIPWVFSWNQSRHGLPGWFGLGAALDSIVLDEGLERARTLYKEWPFFQALVDNAQLALVRADIDVASFYARLADEDARSLFDLIRAEHKRTVELVLQVTGQREILAAYPTLLRTVQRRNPYVDVLSHAQIELLARWRMTPSDERMKKTLFVTINGIAAGLQTAG